MDERRTIFIIANPTSGKGRGRHTAIEIKKRLVEADCDVALHFTDGAGDAERIAADACREGPVPDCIVACGGDGTMQQVAHALATCSADGGMRVPSLGVAPAGRCNDLAHVLGVPTDPGRIADIVLSNNAMPIDLGRANGRYFCTVATLGIDARVSDFVDSMRMPLTGTPAYVYGVLRVLMTYRAPIVRLEGDFGVIEGPVFLASSANTSCYGGNIHIVPQASPTDGRLDLCVIRPVSRLGGVRILLTVMKGRHATHPKVSFVQTRQVRIQTDTPQDIWADGERIAQSPALIEIVPGAVRMLVP